MRGFQLRRRTETGGKNGPVSTRNGPISQTPKTSKSCSWDAPSKSKFQPISPSHSSPVELRAAVTRECAPPELGDELGELTSPPQPGATPRPGNSPSKYAASLTTPMINTSPDRANRKKRHHTHCATSLRACIKSSRSCTKDPWQLALQTGGGQLSARSNGAVSSIPQILGHPPSPDCAPEIYAGTQPKRYE